MMGFRTHGRASNVQRSQSLTNLLAAQAVDPYQGIHLHVLANVAKGFPAFQNES